MDDSDKNLESITTEVRRKHEAYRVVELLLEFSGHKHKCKKRPDKFDRCATACSCGYDELRANARDMVGLPSEEE